MDTMFDKMRRKYLLYYAITVLVVALASGSLSIAFSDKVETSIGWVLIAVIECVIALVMTALLLRRRQALLRNTLMEDAKPPYGDVDIMDPKRAARKLSQSNEKPMDMSAWF